MQKELSRLKEITRKIYLLHHAAALLGWDQETNMPPAGVDERGEQLAVLEGYLHRTATDPEIGDLLSAVGADDHQPMGPPELPDGDRRFLRFLYRQYSREVKLPESLVTEIARVSSKSMAVWNEARKKNQFDLFAPYLEKLLGLAVEKAKCIGYVENPYDPLLDEYEPWMKTAEAARVFSQLKGELATLLKEIRGAEQVREDFLRLPYRVEDQNLFARELLADLGFPMNRVRMDLSAHPFTTTLGVDDVRITTRYQENLVLSGLFSVIHEAGHAFYELGFGEAIRGNILANGTSLGIHESQSRMWENMIGRSRAFWNRYYPRFASRFPSQMEGIDRETLYRGVNKVQPSMIRVEADEVTYSLHIILRFEIEMKLITGALQVGDVPAYWNDTMEDLLGIRPATNAEGCLQDIHWSMGSFGYFPTYSLGNLYAAQFYRQMRKELSDLDGIVERGEFALILAWLRDRIHRHGSGKTAGELCVEITGKPLDTACFMEYLREKYSEIYRL